MSALAPAYYANPLPGVRYLSLELAAACVRARRGPEANDPDRDHFETGGVSGKAVRMVTLNEA